jgi:hypothetical protein
MEKEKRHINMKIPDISKREFLESVKDGIKDAFLTMLEAGDGYSGPIIREPFLKSVEKAIYDSVQDKGIIDCIKKAVGKENEIQDDPVLERIAHELFHLVSVIEKLTDKIEYMAEMTHELGVELWKKR